MTIRRQRSEPNHKRKSAIVVTFQAITSRTQFGRRFLLTVSIDSGRSAAMIADVGTVRPSPSGQLKASHRPPPSRAVWPSGRVSGPVGTGRRRRPARESPYGTAVRLGGSPAAPVRAEATDRACSVLLFGIWAVTPSCMWTRVAVTLKQGPVTGGPSAVLHWAEATDRAGPRCNNTARSRGRVCATDRQTDRRTRPISRWSQPAYRASPAVYRAGSV